MNRNLITLVTLALIAFSAPTLMALNHRVVGADDLPIGDPILMASEDGSHMYTVTGHYDSPGFGITLHVSSDSGENWTETYHNYQGQGPTGFRFDAVLDVSGVYIARIDNWSEGSTTYYELSIQRFDIEGVRDASFGGNGHVSVSGNTTAGLADVSLIAKSGYMEVFWIKNNLLQHSYFSISGGSTTPINSGIPTITAIGSLDSAIMSGDSTDLFAVFKNGSGELTAWGWEYGVGWGLIDITPDENLYPEWQTVTVSSYGNRVEVVVGTNYDSDPTKIHELWSDDDALTWNQEVLGLGWDGVGIHVVEPSVVIGPDQTVVTFMVKDDTLSTEEWGYVERQHGEHWSPSPMLFTPSTNYIGSTMGMAWTPKGGFMTSYWSNETINSLIYFVKLPQLMRTGFEDGDFDEWSEVVGN